MAISESMDNWTWVAELQLSFEKGGRVKESTNISKKLNIYTEKSNNSWVSKGKKGLLLPGLCSMRPSTPGWAHLWDQAGPKNINIIVL